jgi:hypothetical protein
LAALILTSASGCRSKVPKHIPNEHAVYYTTRPIPLPEGSLYFVNTNKQMEAVMDDFEVPAGWRFTGPK